MKFFYQTLFFVFFALSLFILRDDVVSVINNISVYFDNKVKGDHINEFNTKEEIQLPSKIDMPGALRVVTDILNISETSLFKDKVISLTNKQRVDNGNIEILKESEMLDSSAEEKLQDMFDGQYFEHISPSGVGVGDLGYEVGYEYILIGENLAMGNFKDELSLVNAWMASAGHRANILNTHYTEIGVAVGKGIFEGKNIWMAVQHFGTPRSICPAIDQILLGTINLNQYNVKDMEKGLSARRKVIDENNGALYEGSTYPEQIAEYNNLIIPYNNLITELKKQIEEYNNQVRAFNLCLTEHQ